MIPVTYYPQKTHRQLSLNREAIRGRDYAHFFREDLWLHEDVLPSLQQPMDPREAIATNDLNRLLEPGYEKVENGYCGFADGTGYVASLTRFPGATPEMFAWWFWWHSVEATRYMLWFPWNHVSAIARNRDVLSAGGLDNEERYIGNSHDVDEYIGNSLQKIIIEFVEPAALGLDRAAFSSAGIGANACANIYKRTPLMRSGTMIHLARETEDGFELRSRYWLGDDIALGRGRQVNIDRLLSMTRLKDRLAGEALAYEQLLHDQIEFTHLAGILPDLYAEFGPGRNSA